VSKARALLDILDAAIGAADAQHCVPPHLPPPPKGRTVVVGAGKATAAMAAVVEARWPGPLSGLVVTRYGHGAPCTRIEVVEAAHPVPDEKGREAAGRILAAVQGLGADDLVLCLVSGGGSALLTLPAPGIKLAEKQAINRALLRSGAPIGEINTVRKHLSAIKGGRLALAAHPARVVSLLVSDVPGDDPATIASGPTIADPTTSAQALAVLEKYAIAIPSSVRARLASGTDETPKPGDARLAHARAIVVATPARSLAAAAEAARALGYVPRVLGDRLEGEAREVALHHAQIARAARAEGGAHAIISGGELTVTIAGEGGRGGPNAEYMLAMAVALDGLEGVDALACDTDGIDGSEDNAGAVIAPDTLARGRALGLDAQGRLAAHDSYGYFEALDDLVVTGPTRTNVNDLRVILVGEPGR
jgi:hydroxypyruvate reductase